MATDIVFEVPDEIHAQLTQRACAAGLSLSSYLLRELHKRAESPTAEELRARLQAVPAARRRFE